MKDQASLAGDYGVNEDVAANYGPAGRVTGAKLDRQEIIGAGITVVDHIDDKTYLFLSGATGSGDVGMIADDAESRDAA